MNRKSILIVSFALIALGLGLYFFLSFNKPGVVTPVVTTPQFPGEGRPVSSGGGDMVTPTTGEGDVFTPSSGQPLPLFYELHKVPVAGVGFNEEGKGTSRTINARYIERGLGHIYETPLSTFVETRIVGETRSRLSEALFGNNGKGVVIRSFDDNEGLIKTRVINIGSPISAYRVSTSTTPTSNYFLTEEVSLPDYIPFMAASEDNSDKMFYLESGVSSAVGSISSFIGRGTRVFNSSFTEWLPQFPNQKIVTLTTRPSAKVPGHLFFLDPKTRVVTKILGGINGLTTLTSRDGSTVLYSETIDNAPELSLFNVSKRESSLVSLQTLPEKCVWGSKNLSFVYCAVPQVVPSALYPDQWYQGLVSFSDAVWRIDAKTSLAEKLFTPGDFGAPALDIVNLTISSGDEYLLFINKSTGTPWVYQLKEGVVVANTSTSKEQAATKSEAPPLSTTPRSSASIGGMTKLK